MASPGSSHAKVLDTARPRAAAAGAAQLRRWLITAAWIAGALAGFAAYLRLARTRPVNSDGASQALQAWDMLHGNALLHGWTLTDVSFYTTELPEYMLVELARGLGQDVVHVAAALTYTPWRYCSPPCWPRAPRPGARRRSGWRWPPGSCSPPSSPKAPTC